MALAIVSEGDERAALRRAVARLVSAVLECACIRGLPLAAMIDRLEAAAEIFERAANGRR